MNFIAGRVSTRKLDTSAARSRTVRVRVSSLRRMWRSHTTSSGTSTSTSSDSFHDSPSIIASAPRRPITLLTAANRLSTAKRWISATSPSMRDIRSPRRWRP